MFETQRVLMDRIGYDEPDKEEKTTLALLVEIGECANEFRGFKYWSKDQEPRLIKRIDCDTCAGTGLGKRFLKNCEACNGSGTKKINPLLEEYVDGLHFVLQLGIYLNMENVSIKLVPEKKTTITKQFNGLYWVTSKLLSARVKLYKEGLYLALVQRYIGLGEMLGFTWEQIETAYYEKNKVNHARQENGY
jgi:dimeric dUTPase (all-alpha-NTP-PPase superfamily)